MAETAHTFSGTLVQCPQCHAPLVVVEGATEKVTVWGPPDTPYLTPHTGECSYRGIALPDDPFAAVPRG